MEFRDKIISDATSVLKDLLYGDDSVTERDEYKKLSIEEVWEGTRIIVNNPKLSEAEKTYFLNNTWKINYEVKPPTVHEFLTPKWLGAVGDQIYPHVKAVMEEYLSPMSSKRVLALSTCIAFGKSSLATLIALYIIVHLSYTKNPKHFYGLNEAGSLVVALASFTKEKAGQLLLQPFANMLEASPMFHRTLREDRLDKKQEEIEPGHIAYTSAGRMGAFQFTKDIHITLLSDRASLLGLNIFLGIASEISFWIKRGVSLEDIWGTFSDLRGRVESRFGLRPLTGVILDSSPIDLGMSPIDKWIYEGEAEKDPQVMIVNAKHWEIFPERYPMWRKSGKTFPIFKGNASKPPKILTDDEVKKFSKTDIIQVPIDKAVAFQNDLKKQVADFAAWPAGGLAKVVDNMQIVEDMFSDQLNSVYDYVYAPSFKKPEQLIWKQVVEDFFIQLGPERYEFYRAPRSLRTVHLDLSESGDVAGFAMSHFEQTNKGELVVVGDMIFAVSPEKGKINIDALCEFIIDLKQMGGIRFWKVTADMYQSTSILQRLKREGIETAKLSVDRDIAPYRLVVSWMENRRVKIGKNILLKNNFGSLVELTSDKGHTKIDHTKGSIVYSDHKDWSRSFMGTHAKDVSDALVGSAYTLISEVKEIPKYYWVDSDALLSYEMDTGDSIDVDEKQKIIGIRKDILEQVHSKFGLQRNPLRTPVGVDMLQ